MLVCVFELHKILCFFVAFQVLSVDILWEGLPDFWFLYFWFWNFNTYTFQVSGSPCCILSFSDGVAKDFEPFVVVQSGGVYY